MSERLLYFASTDGGSEHRLRSGDFEDSLFYNILFGDAALVVPDVFFFNCIPLLRHVDEQATGNLPFFVQALKKGLVIPGFRSAATTSFVESLAALGAAQIRGIELQGFNVEEKARLLDGNYSEGASPAIWLPNLGERFQSMVEVVFQQPGAGIASEDIRQLWAATESWRLNSVDAAKRLTANVGGTGLRRAELFNAVGHHLGVLDADRSFKKPLELVTAVRSAPHLAHLADQAAFYVDIVNVCYQQNQARGLARQGVTAEPNIPQGLSRAAEAVVPGLRAVGAWDEPDHLFEHTVKLPMTSALLAATSSELIAVREDLGGAYHHHRREWVRNPVEDRAYLLRTAIDEYASEICRVAEGAQQTAKISQRSKLGRTGLGSVAGSLPGIAMGFMPGVSSYAMVAVTVLGGAVGSMAQAIVQKDVTTLGRRQEQQVEVRSYPGPAEYSGIVPVP